MSAFHRTLGFVRLRRQRGERIPQPVGTGSGSVSSAISATGSRSRSAACWERHGERHRRADLAEHRGW
ncbi:MAG: hypothetical protein MZV64_31620 [Ignavibacteriales bacterium]|nr:hypothetical protein [Ignavibacteriales bacterium]